MTSLDYGLDMPYEVQLQDDSATSTTHMTILEPQRSPGQPAFQHLLTPGVYMVSLTYNGAAPATLQHAGGGTSNTVTVPSGKAGSPRTSAPMKISVQGTTEYLHVVAPITSASVRATISVIPAPTFDEMAESAQGVSVLSEISNLKKTKADQSVIDSATHQVGRADTARANRLVKLDENGKLFIATNSIINNSDPVNKSYVDKVAPIPAFAGTGSPEGKVSAPVGSIYTDSVATNGAIRWIKTSGTGSTGWKVEYGDTGYRDITPLFSEQSNNGNILIRMYGRNIDIYFNYARWASTEVTCQLPADWGVIYNDFQPIVTLDGASGYVQLTPTGLLTVRRLSVSTTLRGGCRFHSKSWPVTLPGTPV